MKLFEIQLPGIRWTGLYRVQPVTVGVLCTDQVPGCFHVLDRGGVDNVGNACAAHLLHRVQRLLKLPFAAAARNQISCRPAHNNYRDNQASPEPEPITSFHERSPKSDLPVRLVAHNTGNKLRM